MSDIEYVVNFGSEKSSQFVKLSIAEVECHGARLGEHIVRCRDCKWFTPEQTWAEDRGLGMVEFFTEPPDCGNPERCSHHYDSFKNETVPVHIVTDPNGFCAWGKLRGDA